MSSKNKNPKAVIDAKYFLHTSILARGIMKILSVNPIMTLDKLSNHPELEVDERTMHNIPFITYLSYVINDLESKKLIQLSKENGMYTVEITQEWLEVNRNYTFDQIASTNYSNYLTKKSNKYSLAIAIIALFIAIIALFKDL